MRAPPESLQRIAQESASGTFAPVKSERLEMHPLHEERFDIPEAAAHEIRSAREGGRRVVAVGTTTLRALESAHTPDGVRPGSGNAFTVTAGTGAEA